MEPTNLRELLIDEMKDLYDAEHQIVQALEKMSKKASSNDLKMAFDQHRTQTEGQIKRLEQVFEQMDEKATRKTCKGLKGLLSEGEEMMKEISDPEVLDAALISAAQRVEHYEMAGYGTCRTWANLLGEKQAARLLQQTLDEEGETDKKLTMLAEKHINKDAQMQKAA
ncbi:MAG: ferritin-like domain-containing protein [Armatimonadota bacterium]